jgi:hypothetical protein
MILNAQLLPHFCHYQFLFARNAKHVDRPTVAQTLPAALEWTWKGFPIP